MRMLAAYIFGLSFAGLVAVETANFITHGMGATTALLLRIAAN